MPTTIPAEIANRVPTIRVIAMPKDTNPFGDIFGGWVVSHMDLAGGMHCYKSLDDRVATVGINEMSFCKPVFVGDEVSFYTDVVKTGNTSVSIKVESWAFRRMTKKYDKVTEGVFTYVRINDKSQPKPLTESNNDLQRKTV